MLKLMLIILGVYFFFDFRKYKSSGYSDETGNRYRKVRFNKGLYGEYLTYRALVKVNGDKRILVNTYIPKSDGKTTEIDLILVHETGIYCVESKNFSGWIFGNEKSRYWTQTLKGGQKNKFYNPIMQNKGHIKALNEYLMSHYQECIYSVIVFSERCTLKKVTIESDDVLLVKRNNLVYRLNKEVGISQSVIEEQEIEQVYNYLKKCTQVSENQKLEHIKNVNSMKSN